MSPLDSSRKARPFNFSAGPAVLPEDVLHTAAAEIELRNKCAAAALDVKVIRSGTGGWNYIDVVSAGAGKLESLEHVRRALGFHESATVACGDSGNDILMLSGRNKAIIVGNAQPDLMRWAMESAEGRDEGRLYVARAKEARGILEGLYELGLSPRG